MADEQQRRPPEPRGFGEHTRGLPGEYAHEQGWGLDEEERTRQAASARKREPRDTDGGNDYNYSAQDFGDEPVNMARVGGDDERAEQAARRTLGLDDRNGSRNNSEQKENR